MALNKGFIYFNLVLFLIKLHQNVIKMVLTFKYNTLN